MRVSGASAALVHDSLSVVNVPRRCCRPGCPHYAVATLTFVYSDSTAVIGPLATARSPIRGICVSAMPVASLHRAGGNSCVTPGRCPATPTRTTWWPWRTRCARVARARGAGIIQAEMARHCMVSTIFPLRRPERPPGVACLRRPSLGPGAGADIYGCCPTPPTSLPMLFETDSARVVRGR